MQRRGMLIVISGFSGVGKSTVISHMFDAMPNLRFSVSCTSRKPRAGEKEGVDYYFVTEDEFAKRVANDEFVEYTRTFTNCYGTLKCEVDRLLADGYDILLDINSVGAMNIKKVYPEAVTVFINPPSLEELKKRLIGRGSETPESLKKRLDEIEFESKSIPFYDFVVVNDVALDCSNKIVAFLENKRKELDQKHKNENRTNA
ncbi:MAG: guanylate kinase [Christensenellales bacterium]